MRLGLIQRDWRPHAKGGLGDGRACTGSSVWPRGRPRARAGLSGTGHMDSTPCWHCQGPRSARWHATHAFCKRTLSLLSPNGKRECRKRRASPRTRRCSRIRTHRPNSPRHRKELDCISVTDHARFPRRQFVYVNLHNSLPCIFLR